MLISESYIPFSNPERYLNEINGQNVSNQRERNVLRTPSMTKIYSSIQTPSKALFQPREPAPTLGAPSRQSSNRSFSMNIHEEVSIHIYIYIYIYIESEACAYI